MAGSKTFYVTTPIYYVNAPPTLGSAYTTVVADTLARFHRQMGEEVFFLTGTDEHGIKIAQTAEQSGRSPQEFSDEISSLFQKAWARMGITHDRFIRTTEPAHAETVRHVLGMLYDAGEIYFGEYEGKYCTGCERFYTETELERGRCPDHQTEPVVIKEKNYLFRMSKYRDWLRGYLKDHPEFVRPESYRNEVLSFLEAPLRDLSISRPRARLAWGIPLPFDSEHVCYVWFDALLNYASGIGYPAEASFSRLWANAHHLIGKDILRPHAVYWPAMLRAAGIEPYRNLEVHGFWRFEGLKISKSIGQLPDLQECLDHYGIEPIRYFLLREMAYGSDANFTDDALVTRHDADLANDLGNLVRRTLSMLHSYQEGIVLGRQEETSDSDRALEESFGTLQAALVAHMERIQVHSALAEIWTRVRRTNRYLEENAPWSLSRKGDKSRLASVLYRAAGALRLVAIALGSFLPGTAQRIWEQLGLAAAAAAPRLRPPPTAGDFGGQAGQQPLAELSRGIVFPERSRVASPEVLFPRMRPQAR